MAPGPETQIEVPQKFTLWELQYVETSDAPWMGLWQNRALGIWARRSCLSTECWMFPLSFAAPFLKA